MFFRGRGSSMIERTIACFTFTGCFRVVGISEWAIAVLSLEVICEPLTRRIFRGTKLPGSCCR